jgi:hypothetical protein
MFGTAIDTVVGLVLTFLMFSVLLTIIMEIISGLAALRSKALENSIAKLIEDPGTITQGASQLKGMFGAQTAAAGADGKPQAQAAVNAPFVLSYEHVYVHPLVAGISGADRPSYVPAANFASALVQVLGTAGGGAAFGNVAAAVNQLKDGDLKTALQTLIDQSDGDLEKLRTGIEGWFDSAMDRLSGGYKRFTQVITFIVGLTLAAALNVDALGIARGLYSDPALRASMVAAAEKQVKDGAPTTPGSSTSIDTQLKGYQAASQALSAAAPIGWSGGVGPFDGWVGLGWLLTALAGLLGAPFWFDTLSAVINVRNAGPKPVSSTS